MPCTPNPGPPPTDQVNDAVTVQRQARIPAHAWTHLAAEPVSPPVIDPGNPVGSGLVLVEHPHTAFGDVRILLAVNRSCNPDSTHTLPAIPVPSDMSDPAAAWTYDNPVRATAPAYPGLARRT